MALKIGRDLEATHLTKDPMNSAPNDDILASQYVNSFDSKNPSDYPTKHGLKVGLFVRGDSTLSHTNRQVQVRNAKRSHHETEFTCQQISTHGYLEL